ncbi:MAG: anion transporter [Rhodospirillales bacterium]
MSTVIVCIFVATYLGMALGRVPGLRIERTGIALLAVAALLASGAIDIADIGAAQDAPTLVMLFALMILSAQFANAGFYDVCARRITLSTASPKVMLALTVLISGLLSAILTNDIVAFAMTPFLCHGLAARRIDPRPFLIGLAGGCNAGSAATLIGNPQNILIGEAGGLDFWAFVSVCGPPALLAMVIVYLCVSRIWRDELRTSGSIPDDMPAIEADRGQIIKGVLVMVLLVALFTTPLPRAVSALALAALLLVSRRMASREMIGAVDWHLLLLFGCLFTVTAAFSGTGFAADGLAWLGDAGLLPGSISVLAPLSLLLSNGIGNVPAVILIITIWPDAPEGVLYGLALLSTLAGNLLLVGSLANLIVAERARASGVILGFRDFARAGIPMTLISMAAAALWLWAGGWLSLTG